MPRIAIITPMYNAAATIAGTIDSVLGQGLQDWEWHIMDDGSTDGSVELAEAKLAREARAQVVRNGRVGHIGTLRNRAARSTAAPLLCFLDADDQWAPTFLERQYELLAQTQAHVAHCAAKHIVDGRIVDAPLKYRGPAVCEPPQMLPQLHPANPVYSPSVVIQADAFRAAGGFSEHPDHFSTLDFDLWLRLAPKFRFAFNPEALLYYRVSDQSLSTHPKNQLRNARGTVCSLESAVTGADGLAPDLQRLLKRMLSRRQSQYARLLFDEDPPAIELARQEFGLARRWGVYANRYLPFQLLSLVGGRPPYYLHRALRRIRG